MKKLQVTAEIIDTLEFEIEVEENATLEEILEIAINEAWEESNGQIFCPTKIRIEENEKLIY